MPVAAVPKSLGERFQEASPGMRFTMYLPIWTSSREWRRIRALDSKKLRKEICEVNGNDRKILEALAGRQRALLRGLPPESVLSLPAQSTAPFTTGLGNEHPLENGFSFLWPYGLPYLPGSGVKGVLRQAARELAGLIKGVSWPESHGWDKEVRYTVADRKFNMIELFFGSEPPTRDGDRDSRQTEDFGQPSSQEEHFQGVLTFWDVFPEIKGDWLQVEIMTPHQTHYYQGGDPPHDSGQPNPILFLTVPPGSTFTFYVHCDVARLREIAPDLADRWRELLQAAFQHAFRWLGFGAKTAVGYGAMRLDEERLEREKRALEEKRKREAKERALKERLAALPEDAAWLEARRERWKDHHLFLEDVETFLERFEKFSREAWRILEEAFESRWKGILQNPDATKGRKNKPKYKDRPRNLAKKLLELKP